MREMKLSEYTDKFSMVLDLRKNILPALPGFIERPDGSLFMVYEGHLLELTVQTLSHSVAVTVAVPGAEGLLTRNVADLSFDISDSRSIVKAVGELMQKAKAHAWG